MTAGCIGRYIERSDLKTVNVYTTCMREKTRSNIILYILQRCTRAIPRMFSDKLLGPSPRVQGFATDRRRRSSRDTPSAAPAKRRPESLRPDADIIIVAAASGFGGETIAGRRRRLFGVEKS